MLVTTSSMCALKRTTNNTIRQQRLLPLQHAFHCLDNRHCLLIRFDVDTLTNLRFNRESLGLRFLELNAAKTPWRRPRQPLSWRHPQQQTLSAEYIRATTVLFANTNDNYCRCQSVAPRLRWFECGLKLSVHQALDRVLTNAQSLLRYQPVSRLNWSVLRFIDDIKANPRFGC